MLFPRTQKKTSDSTQGTGRIQPGQPPYPTPEPTCGPSMHSPSLAKASMSRNTASRLVATLNSTAFDNAADSRGAADSESDTEAESSTLRLARFDWFVGGRKQKTKDKRQKKKERGEQGRQVGRRLPTVEIVKVSRRSAYCTGKRCQVGGRWRGWVLKGVVLVRWKGCDTCALQSETGFDHTGDQNCCDADGASGGYAGTTDMYLVATTKGTRRSTPRTPGASGIGGASDTHRHSTTPQARQSS